ncbi:FMN-dependent dehydrogenase-domain-containing protein [Daldinia caldariorum]|uniref:FMN-dependent dehydrogenase-domain-containing protein n=1 Tax=Daldinia caldariorum TaxID=326644 RepID=UPI0020083A76|nr:FMN-dependent dehydrogenase-domain-containing protein [Daldinia caldariorum]KAI1469789.1 FMN-dependent dehydrogenase-domain-containing protein [Daldinia caldariorum]
MNENNKWVADPAHSQNEEEKRSKSMEEMSQHRSLQDLWLLVDSIVYDLSEFALEHPGGREAWIHMSPATILVLLEIRKCLFDGMEVYIDGGITRGTDFFKALCLGERAVGIGRGFLFALNYGREGVENSGVTPKAGVVTAASSLSLAFRQFTIAKISPFQAARVSLVVMATLWLVGETQKALVVSLTSRRRTTIMMASTIWCYHNQTTAAKRPPQRKRRFRRKRDKLRRRISPNEACSFEEAVFKETSQSDSEESSEAEEGVFHKRHASAKKNKAVIVCSSSDEDSDTLIESDIAEDSSEDSESSDSGSTQNKKLAAKEVAQPVTPPQSEAYSSEEEADDTPITSDENSDEEVIIAKKQASVQTPVNTVPPPLESDSDCSDSDASREESDSEKRSPGSEETAIKARPQKSLENIRMSKYIDAEWGIREDGIICFMKSHGKPFQQIADRIQRAKKDVQARIQEIMELAQKSGTTIEFLGEEFGHFIKADLRKKRETVQINQQSPPDRQAPMKSTINRPGGSSRSSPTPSAAPPKDINHTAIPHGYPRKNIFYPDGIFNVNECHVLAVVEARFRGRSIGRVQAEFHNLTGRYLEVDVLKAKLAQATDPDDDVTMNWRDICRR